MTVQIRWADDPPTRARPGHILGKFAALLVVLVASACSTAPHPHETGYPDCFYDPEAPCSVSN